MEGRIVISPIGDVDAGVTAVISEEVNRIFGYSTEILSLISDLHFALDPERSQYHSTSILEILAARTPQEVLKVVAVTHVDLFIPILTHVYGEAQLGGKACIISTCRLKENVGSQKVFWERMAKEAVHELGHTFNLRHCKDPSCLMHYCRTVRDVDMKSEEFCRYCKILLEDELKRLAT
jgi:archaemetzincin